MKNNYTKTEIRFFTVPEWQKEQDYLRRQHQNGWKLLSVNFLGVYFFQRCEPEDVVYQLDYNLEKNSNSTAYVQMFEDCGWEYIQDFWGYSYFRKPVSEMNGEEEIFCDASSRSNMIKQVLKGRILPLSILFFFVLLPQCILNFLVYHPFQQVMAWIYVGLIVFYLFLFSWSGYRFWKFVKKDNL
ncbi:MAG: DUF2812 domain-containing protein [Lachnospiraceae bacterium]|nr:DUF2812 domain-containing protein [Lachnospiraceae bacterium]